MAEPGSLERRLLVLAPTGRDAALTTRILEEANLACHPCADETELYREVAAGAGAALLAQEALQPWTVHRLLDVLSQQGPWSDLPLIVFSRGGDTSEDVLETLGPLGNATILERPVRVSTLVSAAKAALRARHRQYEVRDLLRRQAEADRRKDEFLALLGHELRNPLAAIRNAVGVLDQIGSIDAAPVRQREIIKRQTRHLVRMVDDLLDVSRVTLGKIRLKKKPVDLQESLDRCLTELGMAAMAELHGLDLSIRTGPVVVQGDPVRLEQVICNLLQNAIKYTPRGGKLTVTLEAAGEEGVVRVEDTGIGLSPDMLPYIFEPFTQVESSRRHSEGGLGLGLPLVRGLVEMHGGRVEGRSAGVGRGSEFIVRLPLLRSGTRTRRTPRSTAPPAPSPSLSRSILVVEDNPDGRETLRELLQIWGHRVELAEDGPQGVEKALAIRPEVALIDIGLPLLDGNEVARGIRAVLGPDEIALIAMTGYGQPEDRRRALQAGFDAYLVKPVDPAVLAQLLTDTHRRDLRTDPAEPAAAEKSVTR